MNRIINIPGAGAINVVEISTIIPVSSGGGSPYRTIAIISMKDGDKINVSYNSGWDYERLVNEWIGVTGIKSDAIKEFESGS